jgi:uncharacterized protein (TIGR01777 family)
MTTPRRVLVTGGTGFIGGALVRALNERGDSAIVVSRRPGEGAVGWDAVEREVERADAVVHLAGEPVAQGRWTRARMERIRSSRIDSTAHVAGAIERATRRPSVLVSASAVGIYGMLEDDRELDESAPPADDVLAKIAVAWEAAADPARRAGVRVVHPRTGLVLGRGAGVLARMATPFRLFVGGPIGSGRQWVSWVHLRDTVRALMFAIDSQALAGPVNVVGPEPVTMDAFAQAVARALHRPAALRVPAVALRLAMGRGLAQAILTGQRALPRKLLELGFTFDFPKIEAACADLLHAM